MPEKAFSVCIKDSVFIDFACGTGGFLTSALKVLDAQVESVEDREVYSNSVYGIEKKALPFLLCATNMLLHDIDNPKIIHGNSLEKNVRDYREADRFDIILMNPPYGGNEKEGVKSNFPADLRSSETADLFMSVIMYRSSYGRPQSASYCYKEYKRLLSDNGLPNIRFHDLRHTYATILTNEEIDVKAISNSLGHEKTIITVDVYTDKKQIVVDVSEQTQDFAYEIFPLSYLKESQMEEIMRTRFLKEIYYFPEDLAEEIMSGIQETRIKKV